MTLKETLVGHCAASQRSGMPYQSYIARTEPYVTPKRDLLMGLLRSGSLATLDMVKEAYSTQKRDLDDLGQRPANTRRKKGPALDDLGKETC